MKAANEPTLQESLNKGNCGVMAGRMILKGEREWAESIKPNPNG